MGVVGFGSAGDFLEVLGVKVLVGGEGWVSPPDDEGLNRGMVAEDDFDGEGGFLLVAGEGDDGIRVPCEHAGSGDAVNGFLGGLVALGEVSAIDDRRAGLGGDSFDGIEELGNVGGAVFVSSAVNLVNRVENDQVEVFGTDSAYDFGQKLVESGGVTA